MLKKFVKYIDGYWKETILTPVFVVLETLLEIYIPLVMAKLIDEGINAGDMGAIRHYGIVLLCAAFVSLCFGVAAAIMAPYASSGFAKNLRRALYYKVQDFDFQSIDKFSTASIVTRLTTDVSNVQMAFQMITRICVRAPGMLIFALIAAFSVNRKLAMVFLVVLPILSVGMVFLIKSVNPIFKRVFKTYDKLNNVIQENLYAVRVVKSFNRQKHENDKFKNVSNSIFMDFTKAEKIMAWNNPLMQVCMYTCVILIAWFGSKMILASGNNPDIGMTTGQLMSMITYITQILMSLLMVSIVFVMVIMAGASVKRIAEILDEESNIQNPVNAVLEVKDGSIDFDHVDFRYLHENEDGLLTESEGNGSRLVLEDIDLHFNSGATVGIIGATGSSKSSLVQLIPRLYDVVSGSVKVGGVDVRDYDIEVLRDSVAMVLQKNILFSGTIAENLRWGNADATIDDMKRACEIACADEFIDTFEEGYDTKLEQGGTNLSGGQRQRLCIARALMKNPKILILDDSTSAVDMKTDAKIRQGFANTMPEVTKIIIAQRIASVMDADVILVIDDGKIIAQGSHNELLEKSEVYREIFETQNKSSGADDDFDITSANPHEHTKRGVYR